MKSLKLSLFFFCFCFLFSAQSVLAKSWDFEKWVSDITVNPDSTFVVRETQIVNFQGSFTWLKRDITLKRFKKISDIAVYDSEGRKLGAGEVEISRGVGNVGVKINTEAQDEQKTWTIEYKIYGGIGFFKDYDELYWNAISSARDVPIKSVEVFVRLPQEVPANQIKQRLFTGTAGSKNESQDFEVLENGVLHYKGQNISPYEDFTIVASWPKGIVRQSWWTTYAFYFWFLIPVVTFSLLFFKWWKSGRDPKMKETIIPQYEPPSEMTPAEMGVLVREKVEMKDISATLVDLARRGYLKIVEAEKKGIFTTSRTYNFVRQKDFRSDSTLKEHERLILDGVLGDQEQVSLEDLENKFYRYITGIKNAVLDEVVQAGYFKQNPSRVMQKYIVGGILLLVLGGVGSFLYSSELLPPFAVSLAGIFLIIFGRFMPAKTQKGAEAKWQTLGFKMFLSVAERFRLKANVDPKMFEKYLAFAMVLGVEEKWANRFADIYTEPPDWYTPASVWTAFSLINFSSNISSMSNSFSSVLSSSPSSSSGFGGGGGAGGGGGGGGSSAG